MDFLCASGEGYKILRSLAVENRFNKLFFEGKEIKRIREVRADRYGIRTVLIVDQMPIKFEIVREDRIRLTGEFYPPIPIACLSKIDMYAEKILANSDRWNDKSVLSRDIIDLMMMELHWGIIPEEAWTKAISTYGKTVVSAVEKAKAMLQNNPVYLDNCLTQMAVNDDIKDQLHQYLTIYP